MILSPSKIGALAYCVEPHVLFKDIYVKNLNAEGEKGMARDALVRTNQKLYEGVAASIRKAAALLGIRGNINFHVFGNKVNHKIPGPNLHMALKDGGADSVEMDENKYIVSSRLNDGKRTFDDLITHMHLAQFRV